MEDSKVNLTNSVSINELERRWNEAREWMRENKIDFLVMRNTEEFLGGYVKWFSNTYAVYGSPMTVIFPVDDKMTLINHGPDDTSALQTKPPGVKNILEAPYVPSLHYTGAYDAEIAAGVLKEKRGATIALVGRSHIPVNFCEYLWKHLPESKFVDATDDIDTIKAIKSPEEIEHIKQTAELQDVAMEHVRRSIRPGQKAYEIFSEAQRSAVSQGNETGVIMVGSGPSGSRVPFMSRPFQDRVIREGDQISVLIEVNGPAGFFTEIARIFSVGEPSHKLQDAFEVALEAQELTLGMLRPESTPKDIWDANNEFLQKRGYFPERRLYAHGQGHDLIERPAIRYDETMKIQKGMNIAVHPVAVNNSVWAVITDNYLITDKGVSPCLHKTPKEIICV